MISAHVYGLAVDVAALNNTRLSTATSSPEDHGAGRAEHPAPPAELQAKQVISLFGLGGPSFPLADHDDHIHVGY